MFSVSEYILCASLSAMVPKEVEKIVIPNRNILRISIVVDPGITQLKKSNNANPSNAIDCITNAIITAIHLKGVFSF
ncbi:MAG: hypothetical protein ACTSW8_03005 [Candidatus Thorarchaeota archaeon]